MKISRKTILTGLVMFAVIVLGVAFFSPLSNFVSADDLNMSSGILSVKDDQQSTELSETIKSIINMALYLVGIISVLMLVIGGVRYTVSAGNEKAVTGAKNTILYAIVGIIVTILAYAVVQFVVTNVK